MVVGRGRDGGCREEIGLDVFGDSESEGFSISGENFGVLLKLLGDVFEKDAPTISTDDISGIDPNLHVQCGVLSSDRKMESSRNRNVLQILRAVLELQKFPGNRLKPAKHLQTRLTLQISVSMQIKFRGFPFSGKPKVARIAHRRDLRFRLGVVGVVPKEEVGDEFAGDPPNDEARRRCG